MVEIGRDVEEYMSAIKSLDLKVGFTKEKIRNKSWNVKGLDY